MPRNCQWAAVSRTSASADNPKKRLSTARAAMPAAKAQWTMERRSYQATAEARPPAQKHAANARMLAGLMGSCSSWLHSRLPANHNRANGTNRIVRGNAPHFRFHWLSAALPLVESLPTTPAMLSEQESRTQSPPHTTKAEGVFRSDSTVADTSLFVLSAHCPGGTTVRNPMQLSPPSGAML